MDEHSKVHQSVHYGRFRLIPFEFLRAAFDASTLTSHFRLGALEVIDGRMHVYRTTDDCFIIERVADALVCGQRITY